eukprot:7806542-Pyramimonas_sp.AAC.1
MCRGGLALDWGSVLQRDQGQCKCECDGFQRDSTPQRTSSTSGRERSDCIKVGVDEDELAQVDHLFSRARAEGAPVRRAQEEHQVAARVDQKLDRLQCKPARSWATWGHPWQVGSGSGAGAD